jgi:hypothetical protein
VPLPEPDIVPPSMPAALEPIAPPPPVDPMAIAADAEHREHRRAELDAMRRRSPAADPAPCGAPSAGRGCSPSSTAPNHQPRSAIPFSGRR